MIKSLEDFQKKTLMTLSTPTTQTLDQIYPCTSFSTAHRDVYGFCGDHQVEDLIMLLLEQAHAQKRWVGIAYHDLKDWIYKLLKLEGDLLIQKSNLLNPGLLIRIRLRLEKVLGKNVLEQRRTTRLQEVSHQLAHLPHNEITMDSVTQPQTIEEVIVRAKDHRLIITNYPNGEAFIEPTANLLQKLLTYQQRDHR